MTIPAVETTKGGQPLLLLRPDWSQPARSAVDLLAAGARAREIGGTLHLLNGTHQPVRISPEGASVFATEGPQAAWWSAVWSTVSAIRGLRAWCRETVSSAAREWRRELRRQAGDERLPFELRQRLRNMADSSTRYARREIDRLPRRLLRAPSSVSLSPAAMEQARMQLTARGLADGRPLVTFESRMRPDIAAAAIEFLLREGYTVARVGDRSEGLRPYDAVADLTTLRPPPPLLEMCLVSASSFIVCESIDLQQLAYLTNTPSLVINARDPFMAYPVRANGLFALCNAIDLDTAQAITIGDMLREPYFRDLRKQEARGRRRGSYGYRDNTSEEVIEALKEMTAGIGGGWTMETESQSRFRARVVEAGAELAVVSPHVAEWGPDGGFIGDGRLVQFQADRVA